VVPEGVITVTITGTRVTDVCTLSISATTEDSRATDMTIVVDSTAPVDYTAGDTAVTATVDCDGTHRVVVTEAATGLAMTGYVHFDADVLVGDLTLSSDTKRLDAPWSYVTADPVTIYSAVVCKANTLTDEAQDAATNLLAGEWRALESWWWASQMARTDLVRICDGASLHPVAAVGELLQYLGATYAGEGALHAPRYAMSPLKHMDLLTKQKPVAFAPDDTPFAFGTGYPYTACADAWDIVATGAVKVIQSPVINNTAFDPVTNERLAVAERTFVVLSDCVPPAVAHADCNNATP
jgi:hypothetical protein